jgi:tRNA A-37 threonylcarbamoyl transferase component Bud32
MDSSRWTETRRIHGAALDLPIDERESFLRLECGGDLALYNEIKSILDAESPDEFLQSPPVIEAVHLGDFDLMAEIGSGSTGIVYRAWQHSLSREVALKLLPRHFADNKERVARFQREARAAGKLRHPGIASIFGVSCEGTSHFFTMELIDGVDLAAELSAIRKGEPNSLPEANSFAYFDYIAKLIKGCADALSFAHGIGVVHRDVKPHNIMIDGNGLPHLVDFGLAKDVALGSITITDRVEGTPYYMSPEQARASQGGVGPSTDVYSLGAVLYELLTLARPYEGRTAKEVIDKILIRDPKPVLASNKAVPKDLALICGKAMERLPEFRYESMLAFEEDLQRFLDRGPILAAPPSMRRRALRFCKAQRLPVSVAAVGMFIAVSANVAAKWQATSHFVSVHIQATLADERVAVVGEGWAYPLNTDGFPTEAEPVSLGKNPFNFELPPGTWKCWFQAEGGQVSELFLVLPSGSEPLSLTTILRPTEEARRGMVLVDAGGWDANGSCPFLAIGSEIPPFWADRFEVTVDQYREFCEATGHRTPVFWGEVDLGLLPGDYPATGMTIEDAKAYASWKGKRLLSHAEFDYLLHGKMGSPYCWGDEEPTIEHRGDVLRSVDAGETLEERFLGFLKHVRPVGTFPLGATPDGLLDIGGNVSEYLGTPAFWGIGDTRLTQDTKVLEIHSSYLEIRERVDGRYAHIAHSTGSFLHIGFRCAQTDSH